MRPLGAGPSTLFAILTVTLMVACSDKEAGREQQTIGVTSDEIFIGSSSALTGHASFLGTQYTNGALAWFRELNSRGGIHDRRIRLLALDDQYDPPQTVANTERLINDDQVFMLFNYVGTPTSVEIIDLVQEAQVPAVGFFTGAEALRTPFRPYMFHVRASYYSEAEAAVAYFADRLRYSRIAVMYQDDAFGEAVLKGVELAMRRRNMEIIATATYSRGDLLVDAAAEKIQKSGAEAIVMAGTYEPLALFIRRCHDAGYRPLFHTVSFVGSEAFAAEIVKQEISPDSFQRIIVTQVVPSPYSDRLPVVAEYRRLVMEYFPEHEPNYVALEGFINARVLTEALDNAGPNLTRRKLILMLERMTDFEPGIGKTISFGQMDRTGLADVYYSRLGKDGIFTLFEPGDENN